MLDNCGAKLCRHRLCFYLLFFFLFLQPRSLSTSLSTSENLKRWLWMTGDSRGVDTSPSTLMILRLEGSTASGSSSSSVCTSQRTSPGHYTWTVWSRKLIRSSISWRSLAWMPSSSQTSTGVPSRAYWRTASRSGMTGTVLSTAANQLCRWDSTSQPTDSWPFRIHCTCSANSSRTTATEHTDCSHCYRLAKDSGA